MTHRETPPPDGHAPPVPLAPLIDPPLGASAVPPPGPTRPAAAVGGGGAAGVPGHDGEAPAAGRSSAPGSDEPVLAESGGATAAGELLYGLDDRPPPVELAMVAMQHLLAIFVPILTPGMIVCSALGFDLPTRAYLLNMSLFASGICTLVQIVRIGPIGSGLLSIQGTSFSFINSLIAAGKAGGLPVILGVSLAGCGIEMVLSRFLRTARRLITPLVAGLVVVMIGLTLLRSGMLNCAGGAGARQDGTFGGFEHLGLAALVFVTIVLCNQSRNRWLRMGSIFIGLGLGFAIALVTGRCDLGPLRALPWFSAPVPFAYGLGFDLAAFLSMAVIYLITTIETVGDLTATSLVSRQPLDGPLYWDRISGGVLADGFNSGLAAVFNSFPNTTFSQNNGIIQLTGVASRRVGMAVAGLLIVMGVFPLIGGLFSLLPAAVLGGGTLLMFATIAANGIKIIASQPLDRRSLLVIAISLGLGIGVTVAPEVLERMPPLARDVFGSGITTGGLAALVANALLKWRS